jgi:hypothetical protein
VGILNQLGRPKLDALAVLIRETVQNSWDARLSDSTPLSYTVHGWELLPNQRQILREQVFSERPSPDSLNMSQLDSCEPLLGLIIADRGTTGLDGPTRADIVPSGTPRRFINFLRDVGQPSNQNLSGGTYGYGKASLYLASGMRTILVHSRCKLANGHLESRFIAAALGTKWADEQHRQFTGRHWWGRDEDGIAEPILDAKADKLAEALGMGGFMNDETGTTILILNPLLNDRTVNGQAGLETVDRTPLQALNLMAEYILWFFWPKMLDSGSGHPAIRFHLQWENTSVNLPHPAEFPPLAGFVEAMERLKKQRMDDSALRYEVKEINSERPRQHLGRLALQQFFIQKGFSFDTGIIDSSPFTGITHHTALMRQAELVVKYLEGRPLASSSIGYAGVFIADSAVDSVFAKSEPPTHDDWSPDSLTDRWHKTYVRVALRRINEEMIGFAQAGRTSVPIGVLTPLGAFATWLGESLIPAETGTSASRPPQPSNNTLPDFVVRVDSNLTPAPVGSSTVSRNTNSKGATPFDSSLNINRAPQPSQEPGYTGLLPRDGTELSAGSPDQIPPPAPTILAPTQPGFESAPSVGKPIRGKAIAEIVYDELIEYKNNPALLITFDVHHAENADGTTVTLKARAVLDSDAVEDEPPLGGSMVRAVRWVSPNGEVFADQDGSIFIAASQPSKNWQVLALLPDDMMANIELTARAEAVK